MQAGVLLAGKAGGQGRSLNSHVRDEAVAALALEAIRYIRVNNFAGPKAHEPQKERGFPQ
jgi:hypothetical protein